MKKFLAFLPVLLLIFATACGGGDSGGNGGGTANAGTTNTETSNTGGGGAADTGNSSGGGAAAADTNTDVSGTVNISGSTSVLPYMEMLAAEYMAINRNVNVEVGGGGSSAGLSNARNNVSDIGMSSRNLTDEEIAALNVYEMARDGLAVILHPNNPVTDLSIEQIRGIYTGEITDWAEVGGSAGQITVVTRESGSGTRDAFTEMVMDGNEITGRATVQQSNGVIKATVSDNVNAIGYASLGITIGDDSIKTVQIDGGTASLEEIRAGNYQLFRSFYFVTSPDGVSPATEHFINFILSTGQDILEEEGLVRVVG